MGEFDTIVLGEESETEVEEIKQELEMSEDTEANENKQEIEEENKKENLKENMEKDKEILPEESKYLHYLSELRKADSELALAKAESAELVMQMDKFKTHYTAYEKHIRSLLREMHSDLGKNSRRLVELSKKIKTDSESLEGRIDGEVERLTRELTRTIEEDVKSSCEKELTKVAEATEVLYEYSEQVKEQYIRFQKMEKIKMGLFLISSICSPVVLILLLLNMFHII